MNTIDKRDFLDPHSIGILTEKQNLVFFRVPLTKKSTNFEICDIFCPHTNMILRIKYKI